MEKVIHFSADVDVIPVQNFFLHSLFNLIFFYLFVLITPELLSELFSFLLAD
jgi:hypothetical protein